MGKIEEEDDGFIGLYQFSPQWNLPSSEPHCIVVQAYLRFVGVEYRTHNCNNPHMSPDGKLPFIKYQEDVVPKDKDIIEFLSKKEFHLDYPLTTLQQAQKEAFITLIEHKLYYATIYNWWMESANFSQVTKPLFANQLVFPLNWYLPHSMQKAVETKLKALDMTSGDELYKEATKALQSLSAFLGDNTFFFGDSPSSLDAIAFGHLSVILHAPMPSSQLYLAMQQYPNLVRFCSNILGTFFGDKPAPTLFNRAGSNPYVPPMHPAPPPPPPPPVAVETPEQRKEKMMNAGAVVGALSIMGLYVGAQNDFWGHNPFKRGEGMDDEKEHYHHGRRH